MAYLQSLENVTAGKVLQVKRVMQTSAYSHSSASQTELFSRAITPGSTSNKVLIRCTFRYHYPDGTISHGGFESRLYRDSTVINTPLQTYYYFAYETPQNYQAQYMMFTHMDTVPAATAVTYYYKIASGYGTVITVNNGEMIVSEIAG